MKVLWRVSWLVCAGGAWLAAQNAPPAITLAEALAKARQHGGVVRMASLEHQQAREDTRQARAARLPQVNAVNEFIYTQPNGADSWVFVSNDGVHLYNEQAVVHQELLSIVRRGEVDRALAAEAVAKARTDIAARGLFATVIQNYYAIVSAQRHAANLETSVREAARFTDLTAKQEKGGEAAHADVLKAQLDLKSRQRDLAEAQLGVVKAKIALGVLIFPSFTVDFNVADDVGEGQLVPPIAEAQAAATTSSPDLKAAEAGLKQAGFDVKVARYAWLPSFGLDFLYGINANHFAAHTALPGEPTIQNLGYAVQASLNLPVWNWGATRSKIKQAEFRRDQAQIELSVTQREVQSNLAAAHAEASAAQMQIESLRSSLDLARESLRLMLLRYQAGEATALEVVDAQNTLTEARNGHDDGLVRRRVALANLQTLMGAL